MNETPNSAICKLFVNCNLESTFRTVVWQTDSQIIWIFVDKTTPANHEWWFFFFFAKYIFYLYDKQISNRPCRFLPDFFSPLFSLSSSDEILMTTQFYKNNFCNFNLIPLTMIRVYKFKILISNVNILLVCYFCYFWKYIQVQVSLSTKY